MSHFCLSYFQTNSFCPCSLITVIAKNISVTCRASVLDSKQNQAVADIPLEPLLQRSSENEDCERVSTGTKYALQQFLLKPV